MKTYDFIFVLVLSLLFTGCQRSFRDADLVGSWQLVTNGITQTYTFSSDHTFTTAFKSSKDLRNFGEWTLNANQVAIVLHSSSFSPTIVSNRTTALIVELTPSVLILKDQDRNDEPRERAWTRVK